MYGPEGSKETLRRSLAEIFDGGDYVFMERRFPAFSAASMSR